MLPQQPGQPDPTSCSFYHYSTPFKSIPTFVPQISVWIYWKHMQFFWNAVYPIMGYSLYPPFETSWDFNQIISLRGRGCHGDGSWGDQQSPTTLPFMSVWLGVSNHGILCISTSILHHGPSVSPLPLHQKESLHSSNLIKLENQFQKLQNNYRKLFSNILFF